MDRRIKIAFLALVLTQIAHSVEEYAFRFYTVFPPARLLNDTPFKVLIRLFSTTYMNYR